MHHGFYPTPDFKDHKAAQLLMIDRALEWAFGEGKGDSEKDQGMLKKAFSHIRTIIDVGCGVGGSSRHIIKRHAANGTTGVGISLSPYQVARANQFTTAENLTSALHYNVADATDMPFSEKSFDLGNYRYSNVRQL